MNATRRDICKFAAGSAAGILVTPLPWKLFRASAVWTQNWSWMPRPLRGELKIKETACTLCPHGCAVKARCVSEQPFQLAGALCAAGFAAHQLPYHPARLRTASYRGKPVAMDAAAQRVREAIEGAKGTVAILDCCPGRAASAAYKKFAYYTPAPVQGATLAAIRNMTGAGPLGLDLKRVKTLVSFGTPVLEGWGAPGYRPERLIQIEARHSRTASLADVWVQCQPGMEALVAAEVGRCLDPKFPQFGASGLSAETIQKLAAELQPSALAIADCDPPLPPKQLRVIAALNLLIGAQAVVPRQEAPVAQEWNPIGNAADGSITLLLIDESRAVANTPWAEIQPKLAQGAVVVVFANSPYGLAPHADYVIPAPVFGETAEDVPASPNAAVASVKWTKALQAPPATVMAPSAFLGLTVEEGKDWTGEAQEPRKFAKWSLGIDAIEPVLAPQSLTLISAPNPPAGLTPTMLTKLYQESDLMPVNQAALHPVTAKAAGLREGSKIRIETRWGVKEARVTIDKYASPGVVDYSPPGGRSATELCGRTRTTPTKVEQV